MSDWKDNIDEQIAFLDNGGPLIHQRHNALPICKRLASTMQALQAVAVAVEDNLLQPEGVIYLHPPHPVAIAHNKLREASDE